jgi:hypothetical protein
MESHTFSGILISNNLKNCVGDMHRYLKLTNKYNPLNELSVQITFDLTSCIWKFGKLENNSFLLPTIDIPSFQDQFSDDFFVIKNESNETLDVTFSINNSTETKEFLSLEIMDHSTTMPMKEHKFLAQSSLDLRVRCIPIVGSKIPENLFKKVITENNQEEYPNTIYFGKIEMKSVEQPTEIIKVYGTIRQNLTFSLSTNRLLLHNEKHSLDHYMDVFTIQNLSSTSHLNFKVKPLISETTKLTSIRIIPEEAVVDAMNNITISLFVKSSEESLDEEFSVQIVDLFHPLSQQTIPAQFISISTPLDDSKKNSFELVSPRKTISFEKPKLLLKGCNQMIGLDKRSNGYERYEIDLGQQNYLSEELQWDISLENTSSSSVSYRITIIGGEEEDWLKLSRAEGILKEKMETQIITLKFSKKVLNNFMTYIVIENLNNAEDLKFIRIHMETVVGYLIDSLNAFKIFIDEEPIEKQSVMDMGDVFVNEMIHHHCIDIVNLMDIPLEFHLSSTHNPNKFELHFSLSLTSLKSFDNLHVDANKSIRIYIMFKPTQISMQQEEIEIFLKCRILKDFQERFILRAKINEPQMKCSPQELLFIGTDEKLDSLNISPKNDKIKIKNLKEKNLKFLIKTSSLYFDIEPISFEIKKKKEIQILIKPNIKKILENQSFKKLQYIEEHLFIYNVNDLSEKYSIDLRLTRGHIRQFYTAPGTKTGYTFSNLENQIVVFLTNFSSEKNKQKFFLDLIYLIDELIYYCLKGRVSEPFFDLAKLLFEMLYNHKIFDVDSKEELLDKKEWVRIFFILKFRLICCIDFFLIFQEKKKKKRSSFCWKNFQILRK